jgi:hypothetical protein
MAAMAMGAAPVLGGVLPGAAVGQLRGPDMRAGIKQDLELLEQMPVTEAGRRQGTPAARQATSYEGSWRDIVLFACTVIVWWSVDHGRDSWLPVFIIKTAASVVAGGYAIRGMRRSARRVRRRATGST